MNGDVQPLSVQAIFDDIGDSGNPVFFGGRCNGPTPEAKMIMSSLRTLVFGTAPHVFNDYYPMSRSQSACCSEEFDRVMAALYKDEYLRSPTAADLKAINQLHKSQHVVHEIYGSLDCMHLRWKNCPTAWQDSFSNGKEKNKPSIILEGMCDYNLWFWNCFLVVVEASMTSMAFQLHSEPY